MRVEGKVAIVTGAGSGLGKAIAIRLAGEGARVIAADINRDAVDATVRFLRDAGAQAEGFCVDVGSREETHELVDQIIAKLDRIDILVNNAGVTHYAPFDELSDQHWDRVLAVNLKGVFYCSQAVAPHMKRARSGKIVNISSVAGTGASSSATGGSPAGSSAYAASKAGVIQLTKTLAREMGPYGVNVNAIAPGFFLTPLTSATRTPEQVQQLIVDRSSACVLNRAGDPVDLANAVLFLVSAESSFVSGQTLCVDGGRTDRM